MWREGRRTLRASERCELWERWQAGETYSEIGRALGVARQSVFRAVMRRGGLAPRQRQRRAGTLQVAEREEISRGLAEGCSLRHIARQLGRAASTVSREIACLLARHERLRQAVAEKLQLQWSPEQISCWLVRAFPDDKSMRVSPETVYRSLFVQARGVLKKQLCKQLRSRRLARRPRAAGARVVGATGQILGAVSIRERPAEVEDRAVPGHWEGDLLIGSRGTQIATLVERQSRFVMLVKMPSKDSALVAQALAQKMGTLPRALRRSLTWDRGFEMREHKSITLATELQVYFCDPHSPWQRGSNENTNGLLRQYFPKGKDLSGYSQEQLDEVALRLNQRPRKTLDFRTPADKLNEVLR